ncbi:hypothetical protein IMZ31_06435 [Pontibacillus sp. ALD_SL1]|uniref:hypothetical protein n=1 Tax=Pontibacillus sp. ALD_SL1 TaxID=2777185 RepID=UPI001A96B834|nr:hypothetical protein [Pontibacillus sp. ALD_SL1]QST01195.1 hypothetical protein IMZ31_06435 [Pontibacillus sp. ALD_SL1]
MSMNAMNRGSKLILLALAMAVLSFFFAWVDAGILSENGFQQQGYIFLVFFVYPVFQVIRRGSIRLLTGYGSAIGGSVSIIAYMISKSGNISGERVNLASTGMYIFLISTFLLIAGIYLSRKEDATSSVTDASPLSK